MLMCRFSVCAVCGVGLCDNGTLMLGQNADYVMPENYADIG